MTDRLSTRLASMTKEVDVVVVVVTVLYFRFRDDLAEHFLFRGLVRFLFGTFDLVLPSF